MSNYIPPGDDEAVIADAVEPIGATAVPYRPEQLFSDWGA